MKSLKISVLISSLTLSLANTTFAETTQLAASTAATGFTVADTQSLFESEAAPMQLAALSPTEMRETEGAWQAYAVGAVYGFGTYAVPKAWTAARTPGSFTQNYINSWDTRQAIFSTATGALFGGLSNSLLMATGTTINYASTTFLKSFHTPAQQFTNNLSRTYTTSSGLTIAGSSLVGSTAANQGYNLMASGCAFFGCPNKN